MTRHTVTDFELYEFLQHERPHYDFRIKPDRVNGGIIEARSRRPVEHRFMGEWHFIGYRDDKEREAVRWLNTQSQQGDAR